MDNNEIRRKILEVLYDQEMNNPKIIPKGILKKKSGIEYNKLDPNINYLEDKGYIQVTRAMGGYYATKITAKGIDYIENNEEVKSNITQHFHGNIENFALGDINNYNTSIYLNALITAIEESEDIPPQEKKDLVDKIKSIASDPYVSGIGAGLIVEAIKTMLIGK